MFKFRSILLPAIVASSFLLSCSGHAADDDDADAAAPLLTDDNFADTIKDRPHFVMFFAPWCGHCKKLAPVWQELHETLSGFKESNEEEDLIDGMDVGVARVDCTKQTALCSKHQVTGYPTLKFFKNGVESQRYKGGRTLDDLITYLKKELGLIDDPEDVDELKLSEQPSGPKEYTVTNFDDAISSGHHFIKFFAPWCGHCQRLAPVWQKLGEAFPSSSRTTIGKVDCTEHREVCNKHGVKGYPTLLWFTDGEQVGEKYAGDRSYDSLKTFVLEQGQKPSKAADAKDAEPTPSPAQQASSVASLSDADFESTINEGITLVKFFAPWCGHCKKMAGAYEQLGSQFSEHPSIKIAEVDCTVQGNRELCSQQKVKGFPSILIYKNGANVASYEGDRSTNDMAEFVTSHLQRDEL